MRQEKFIEPAEQVQSLNLRPAPFGSKTGLRFELQYLSESGLSKKAGMLGVVDIPKYHPEFERIVQSIRVKA